MNTVNAESNQVLSPRKSNDLNACELIHESIQACNRTHPVEQDLLVPMHREEQDLLAPKGIDLDY